ncbi:MAG: 3,4-dihydroxy-2-butanone 4-phosphate synthase/GTP cyclohydrolase II [Candidatus Magasanikbacteria bacterium GW2011_GWD2_43_18]|uniref:GTP cyclohydrolase-2 n=1 Tax=Candidatus Magasanikbacteria bacterium GW2011_GWE2_42_7 TaxID=1619052 RepID=A0A0G1BCX6_9BACT|nr:MAG: 3,4-dihydroxy-2-butanone 4-phosphate synthase/GTP cyclohydrolase II [Candidatus Magasanikbacteria bacterium GW2011_GWC2_42_27]KKS71039.1 MAG: 3,4-dihydroxy-2-butanone 4-phosphate synthase/GTP cyclohydrolase II [Candidatus Magasanikbacteria bacterium GW2011_GWE2_42_7]KKT03823.1 MAG: 3,4-dihydroxy-2-butanone 4-phosphate synthase/GTP cyclohydrolase II [Candidatus Magasanikbacteria bacterium GW2011_GWD2_43_18]KKT25643.1 MAG: 3,4-dihydroxy-2-butanone 4-phosphate synthase/GTP cyclohydrolase II
MILNTNIVLEASSTIQTSTGEWVIRVYRDVTHHHEQIALIKGNVLDTTPVLVRVHSECATGDVFGSLHCDCGEQLHAAMKKIDTAGSGVLLYMKQEGRGIGLANKIKAYELQRTKGLDTVEANEALGFVGDARTYDIVADMLRDIGLTDIILLTNNPKKAEGIESFGMHVVEQVSLEIPANGVDDEYLKTKKEKMGHIFLHI